MIAVNWYTLNSTYNDTIMNQSDLATLTDSLVCPLFPAICPVICPVIRPMSTNTIIRIL